MSEAATPSRGNVWIYTAAWVALLTIYSAALIANGLSIGLALRNALASLLPDALLGLAVLALMSLAYAHSRQTPPDLHAAFEEANAALKLEPDWSYVRDNLFPQIRRQLGPDER